MSSVQALNADYIVCYRMTREPRAVRLKLWEPSPSHADAPQPYLYALNYSFRTLTAAEQFLREFLLVNGAFDVPDHSFPTEGAIAILPFPTWNSAES